MRGFACTPCRPWQRHRKTYQRFGFRPTEAYVFNPIPGTRFLSLDLALSTNWSMPASTIIPVLAHPEVCEAAPDCAAPSASLRAPVHRRPSHPAGLRRRRRSGSGRPAVAQPGSYGPGGRRRLPPRACRGRGSPHSRSAGGLAPTANANPVGQTRQSTAGPSRSRFSPSIGRCRSAWPP